MFFFYLFLEFSHLLLYCLVSVTCSVSVCRLGTLGLWGLTGLSQLLLQTLDVCFPLTNSLTGRRILTKATTSLNNNCNNY